MMMQNRFGKINLTTILFSLLFIFVTFQTFTYSQNNNDKKNDSQEDIIQVDTNLVSVPVTVLDRDGRYISNLKKEDFQIFENGIEQEVVLFESTKQQITVLLLLDLSDSMKPHILDLGNAANVFVSQLRPDDQLIAATFNIWVNELFGAKNVRDIRNGKKLQLRFGEQKTGLATETMVYDAVEYALKKMKKIRGRKAIVLFSDGIGSGYSASAKSNFRDTEESEALIYTVRFENRFTVRFDHESEKDFRKRLEKAEFAKTYMRDLAQISGGRTYEIEKIADLESTFTQITAELGQQYFLGYYPKTEGKKGERRQIKVKVNIPNVAVRARSSYVIGQNK